MGHGRVGTSEHDRPVRTVAQARGVLAEFAATFPDLRLYRAICEGAARDDDVASILLSARPGQARPILLLAAVHDLVLRRPEVAAARWYPSVTDTPPADGDPWPDVRRTILEHRDELCAVVAARTTQTNEVNRAVHLAPVLARAAADVARTPVVLVEMGCSAGLLLGMDRFRIELGGPDGVGAVLGDPGSPVRCAGRLLGGVPEHTELPEVVGRVGLDLHPVDLEDVEVVRWLEACLWPDVPGRLERFRAAVALMRTDPPTTVAGDMVEALGPTIRTALTRTGATATGPAHVVVFSSWALTYVTAGRRADVAQVLARVAADGHPVSWLTAEPPGCVPGLPPSPAAGTQRAQTASATLLGARLWRDGTERPAQVWGTAHPHGEWLDWAAPG